MAEGCAEGGVGGDGLEEYERESRTEEAVVAASEEQRVAQARLGDLVAMRPRDSFDQAVQAQAAQVIGDGAGSQASAKKGLEPLTQIGVGEAAGQKVEDCERVEQGLDAFRFEAQGGSSLLVYHARALNGVKPPFSDRAVVADSLDVE